LYDGRFGNPNVAMSVATPVFGSSSEAKANVSAFKSSCLGLNQWLLLPASLHGDADAKIAPHVHADLPADQTVSCRAGLRSEQQRTVACTAHNTSSLHA
jgi:hypothetical protein